MAYIGKSPTGTGVRSRFHFTASGSETSLSGADDNGKTLVFADGEYVDVYVNGVLLFDGDYNTTTANTIGGLAALSADDVVEIVVYDIFSVADTVSAKNGGTFSGDVIVNGDISATDGTFSGNVSIAGAITGTTGVGDSAPLRIADESDQGATFGIQNDGDLIVDAETKDIAFQTNDTERMRILSSGGITFNGDTAAANALDDYEEGTFSANFYDQGLGASVGTATGYYVKIGNVIHVSIFQNGSFPSSSPSGTLVIKNLPFIGSSNQRATGVFRSRKIGAGTMYRVEVAQGANQIGVFKDSSETTGTTSSLLYTNNATNERVALSISYQVD